MIPRMFFSGASVELGLIPFEVEAPVVTTKPWYFRQYVLRRRG